MKKNLTNWMLLIGAVLLGAFILIFERGIESSHQMAKQKRTVFSVYPESIERILLQRDGVQIECTKTAGIWRLTQPADAPVDSGIVEKMITGLAHVERGELITAETLSERNLTPSDYGFDTPRARITFKNNHGTFTWLIGRDAPLGSMLYVMPEGGGDIISAPNNLINLIPTDPAWIRDRTVFTGEPTTVRGLDLRRTGGFLRLRQIENTGWVMQQPHDGRADNQAVHTLIGKLFTARILDFITDEKTDLTAYGLEEPAYELTLFSQEEKTQTLLVGKPLPDNPEARYAKRVENHSVFTVPAEWTKELETESALLRSRRLISLQPDRITNIKLIRGEQQLELTRTNTLWQIERPVRWETDPAKVTELIQSLADASIVDFLGIPSAEQADPMKAPAWNITLTADGKTNTLHISDPGTNELRLIQYDTPPSLCTANEKIVRNAFIDPLFYRSRMVLEINPTQIETISLQKNGEAEQSVQKTAIESFASGQPNRQVNAGALTGLMWELNDLVAVRYVDYNPVSLEPYGLDQPHASLTVTLSNTNAIGRMILIGNSTEDGRFATIQGLNIVFVISEKTAETFLCELTVPIENQAEEIKQP